MRTSCVLVSKRGNILSFTHIIWTGHSWQSHKVKTNMYMEPMHVGNIADFNYIL